MDTPFLTDLDSRAAIKGSRDPLGVQPIWTRFGRHVVGNLTTVSDSARDFGVVVFGHYLIEQRGGRDDGSSGLATFLKWEQLAGYARAHVNGDLAFRGTERVQQQLSERTRVYLSGDAQEQILGDQKNYGLWGLYSVPSRASGLLEGEPARLTDDARSLVEQLYLPVLAKNGLEFRALLKLLERERPGVDCDSPLLAAVAHILRLKLQKREAGFFREHLAWGGPTDSTAGLQRLLAEILDSTSAAGDMAWSAAMVRNLAKHARQLGEGGPALADRLDRIVTCESVLAVCAQAFSYLQGCENAKLAAVAKQLRDVWGKGLDTIDLGSFAHVVGEMAGGDPDAEKRWEELAEALANGDYARLVQRLLDQNSAVMSQRGGSPWILLRKDRLDVRFQYESASLPSKTDLGLLWRSPYFLESLRRVTTAVSAGSP